MFERFLTDKQVEKRYIKAGEIFGDALSYGFMGECSGFKRMLAKWEKWEAEYIKRGYRTLPIDDFIDYGGYGVPLPLKDIWKKRDKNEKPIFHAKTYRDIYLGKIKSVLNIAKLLDPTDPTELKIQIGTYCPPSTKMPE